MKILCLCDSPTLSSGFARVAQNLFKRWARQGATIHVWGIAFIGYGYRGCPYVEEFFPAGVGGEWTQPDKLKVFLQQLHDGGYSHVWIMQDSFLLSANGFPKALKDVCKARGIRSMYYFPVDAPFKPAWTEIMAAVDVAVAYTEFGLAEAKSRLAQFMPTLRKQWKLEDGEPDPIPEWHVLPHGVDTSIYRPLSDRETERTAMWEHKWVAPDDFLIINVNSHQRRKDITRSLEILKAVKQLGAPAKMILHMSAISDIDVNLEVVGEQLGLKLFEDWAHHGQMFHRGQGSLPELPTEKSPHSLMQLYNICDLYLTTTLGEGWGLGITEALACGTSVAMPEHTACQEIGNKLTEYGMETSRVMLPLEAGFSVVELDNSRCRPRASVPESAQRIKDYYDSGLWRQRAGLTHSVREWLSWDRIARTMLGYLRGTKS
jgi:glycosyltransferase involved in cell wall biosynthesis